MASTYEKSVKGATKVKLAAPKSKYIEHLLMATQTGAVDQIFRPLSFRLKDSTWTIVFKSLIVTHIMIRDGAPEVALRYLANQPRYFSTSHIPSVSEQGENIHDYARYLQVRTQAWRELKYDYAAQRPGPDQAGRLKKLSVEKGLLREVEGVSRLTGALLKCKFYLADLSNDITLTAFRLLVSDLLALFQPLNEGVMNVLSHYFEMSRTDAERALRIYKTFVERTNEVIEYLSEAKALEHAMRLQIPNVKHAPTGLTQALEEYLNDPDFETNRKQYLEGRERGKSFSTPSASNSKAVAPSTKPAESKPVQPSRPDPTNPFNSLTNRQTNASAAQTTPNNRQQNMVDFFNSIENEQTAMFPATNQQAQPYVPQAQVYANPGFNAALPYAQSQPQQFSAVANPQQQFYGSQPYPAQQPYNSPQPPMRPDWTGAGFGGYTPSSAGSSVHMLPTIQDTPLQPQFTAPIQSPTLGSDANAIGKNPFRSSTLPPLGNHSSDVSSTQSQLSTNPFAAGQRPLTMSSGPSTSTPSLPSQPSFASLGSQPSTFNPSFQNPPQTASTFSQSSSSPFQPPPQQAAFQPPQASLQVSSATGTNPFSRNPPGGQAPQRLQPQVTGSNPFRQSMMPGTVGATAAGASTGFGWSQS